ncbi:MAG: hypothetical protein QW835_00585 [Candidatus Hadarchaeum sp.]
MPFFIKHYPYTRWDVVLVKADSLEAVENLEYDDEHEEYLGEFIDISDEDCQIIGPFPTREAALIHARTYCG